MMQDQYIAMADRAKIKFVCGRLASGKSRFLEIVGQHSHITVFEVSTWIKEFAKLDGLEVDRSVLQQPRDVTQFITDKINHELELVKNQDRLLYIGGLRDVKVLNNFPDQKIMWLDAPPTERLKRIKKRGADKDRKIVTLNDLLAADMRDDALGLKEIEQLFNTYANKVGLSMNSTIHCYVSNLLKHHKQ